MRNQARVHVWYEDHFGMPCPPLRSNAEAIDRYAAYACPVGMRTAVADGDGDRDGIGDGYEVYAPRGSTIPSASCSGPTR